LGATKLWGPSSKDHRQGNWQSHRSCELKDDPWYVQAFRQAVIEAGDSLQDKLTEMAFEGNVTAAIFLLKGLKPETFRDRLEQTSLLEIDPEKLTPRQLDVIAEHLIAKALAGKPEAAVAEARRRLEAGETVTVEAIEIVGSNLVSGRLEGTSIVDGGLARLRFPT